MTPTKTNLRRLIYISFVTVLISSCAVKMECLKFVNEITSPTPYYDGQKFKFAEDDGSVMMMNVIAAENRSETEVMHNIMDKCYCDCTYNYFVKLAIGKTEFLYCEYTYDYVDYAYSGSETDGFLKVTVSDRDENSSPSAGHSRTTRFKIKFDEQSNFLQTNMNDSLLFTLKGSPIDSITTVCGQGIVSYYDTTGVWYHLVEE